MRLSSGILVSLSFFLLPAAHAALDDTAAVYTPPPSSSACPVQFSVKRSPNSGLVLVKPGHSPLSQGLKLNFTPAKVAITRAFITVHGMSPRAHVLPTISRLPAGEDAAETFVLSPASGQSAVWTEKMSAISWVELTRLEYADGTSWQTSAQSHCSAAPSLFVLVDAEAQEP